MVLIYTQIDYGSRQRSTATALCRLTAPSMPGLTVVGACELGQDAERAGLGGTGARLPVFSVLDKPLLAMVIWDKAWQVLHPQAVPAHTHTQEQCRAGAR